MAEYHGITQGATVRIDTEIDVGGVYAPGDIDNVLNLADAIFDILKSCNLNRKKIVVTVGKING